MRLEAIPVEGLPELQPGDDLAEAIADRTEIVEGDIVAIAQKAVSKVENRFADPAMVEPSQQATSLALETGKDPRLVELILSESCSVVRSAPGVLVVETKHGFICANAGIDSSNVPGDGRVLLLPKDPDESARALRSAIRTATEKTVAVIVTDSFGRAWRSGQSDLAIGCAGIDPLLDLRGQKDRDGRTMSASLQAVADELAGAADMARDKRSGHPVVILRGRADLVLEEDGPGAAAALRERAQDLFR